MKRFNLRLTTDLLNKLRYDLAELKRQPGNAYLAFNFFASAAQVPDWLHPGDENGPLRQGIAETSPLVRLSKEIAEGKVQLVLDENHDVSEPRKGWLSSLSDFAARGAAAAAAPGQLLIDCRGDGEKELGRQIDAVSLAARIVAFWQNYAELKETAVVRRGAALAAS
jgi:hypothetical protein